MRILVTSVENFTSRAGKPCFTAYIVMPRDDGSSFLPPTKQFVELAEWQALAQSVPCWAEADQHMRPAQNGGMEVKCAGFRDIVQLPMKNGATAAPAVAPADKKAS